MVVLIILFFLWNLLPLISIVVLIHLVRKCRRLEDENISLRKKSTQQAPSNITGEDTLSSNKRVNDYIPYMPPPLSDNQMPVFQNAESVNSEKPESTHGNSMIGFPVMTPPPPPKMSHDIAAKSKGRSFSTVMVFGVIFVVLAGLVFASTSWADMNNIVRIITIFSFSVIFFITSSLVERKLILERTGAAFYILGSFFLPITLFAAGYFEVFGKWFSLFGDGRYLLISAAFTIMALVFAKGSSDYSSKVFSWSALFSASVAFLSLMRQMPIKIEIFFILAAVYSLLIIAFSGKLSSLPFEKIGRILSNIPDFSAYNASIISVLALFMLKNSVLSFVALIIFAACFLFPVFHARSEYFSVIPFTIFAVSAFFRLFVSEGLSGGLLPFSSVLLIASLLSVFGRLDTKLSRAHGNISFLSAIISLYVCFLNTIGTGEITLEVLISSAITSAGLAIFAIGRNDEGMKGFLSLSLINLAIVFSKTIFTLDIITALGFSGFVLSILVIFVMFDNLKLRNLGTDIILVSSLVISGMNTLFLAHDFDGELSIAATIAILMAAAGAFICSRQNAGFSWLAAPCATLAILPVKEMLLQYLSPSAAKWTFFTIMTLWIALLLAATIVISVKKPSSKWIVTLSASAPIIAFLVFISMFLAYPVYIIMLILCGYFIARMLLCRGDGKPSFMICAYVFSIPLVWSAVNYHISESVGVFEYFVILGFQSALYWLMTELFLLYDKESKVSRVIRTTSSISLSIFSALCMVWYCTVEGNFLTLSIIFIMALASCVVRKSHFWLIPSLVLFFPSVFKFSKDFASESTAYFVIAGLVVIYLALGRLIYQLKIMHKSNSDVYSLTSLVGISMFFDSGTNWRWAVYPFIALWILHFLGRTKINKWIITFSIIFAILSWWTQPFIKIPEIISLELDFAPLIIFCGAMTVIWKNKREAMGKMTFFVTLFTILVLGIDAMSSSYLLDSIIVAVSAIIMLLASFSVRLRRWFTLGVVTLSIITISMASTFWTLFGWWSYLMLAGIILIGLGARNELKKKRLEEDISSDQESLTAWKW